MKGNKVYQIIEEEFDNRLGLAVIFHLLSNGLKNVKGEPLEKYLAYCSSEKEWGFKEIKCAKRIANECSDLEILRYIVGVWGPILKIESCNDYVK